jgi:hypothetical protein
MAGGVWWLEEWDHWIDNPELGPIAFQFGTRPLLTKESPISDAWKQRLLTLKAGDVYLHRSRRPASIRPRCATTSCEDLRLRVRNGRWPIRAEPVGDHVGRIIRHRPAQVASVYLTEHDKRCMPKAGWRRAIPEAVKTPGHDAGLRDAGPVRRKSSRIRWNAWAACRPLRVSPTGRRTRKGPYTGKKRRSAQLLHPEDAAEHQRMTGRLRAST